MRRHLFSLLVLLLCVMSASSRAGENAPDEEEAIYQGRTLAEWIGDLQAADSYTQSAAAGALEVFGPKKEAVAALATALKNDNVEVVLAAAQTLGKFGGKAKDALPALRAAYKKLSAGPPPLGAGAPARYSSEDDLKKLAAIRRTVAESMILIDDQPSAELAPILVEALKSDNADRCRDIITKLGKLGPEAAKTTVPALIGVLADTERSVQRGSGNGYVTLSGYSAPYDFPREKVVAIRVEAVKALGRIGPAARPALHALTLAMKIAAPDKVTSVQRMELSDKPAGSSGATIQSVSFTLITGDTAMLRACAEALAHIRPDAKGTVGALRLPLRDLDEGIRWAALCALVECGDDAREVVPILLNFARDKTPSCRRLAVDVLGKSKADAKPIVPALMARLKDEDASVRQVAAKALGEKRAKAKSSAPALIATLKDANAEVRREAAESLGKIGAADKDVIAALIAALRDTEGTVVGAAGMALAGFGDKGKAGIPALLELTQSTDAKQRGRTCILLGFFGPAAKEAIPALDKLAQEDAEECVRLAAITGLAKIDAARLQQTVRRLITALDSKTEEVCGVAVECLGYLGPDARDALPALRALKERSKDFSLSINVKDAMDEIDKPNK